MNIKLLFFPLLILLFSSCKKCYQCEIIVLTDFFEYEFTDYECGKYKIGEITNDFQKIYETRYPDAYYVGTFCIED